MSDFEQDMPAPGVCCPALYRPEAHNALTYAMYEELNAKLEAIRLKESRHGQ